MLEIPILSDFYSMLEIPRCYDKILNSNNINKDRLFIGLLGKDWFSREVLQEILGR